MLRRGGASISRARECSACTQLHHLMMQKDARLHCITVNWMGVLMASLDGACNLVISLAQVRSIMGQIRPDRQTLMFSATMSGRMERLARDALTSPLRISVGEVGAANEDIKQAGSFHPSPSLLEPRIERATCHVLRNLAQHCSITQALM